MVTYQRMKWLLSSVIFSFSNPWKWGKCGTVDDDTYQVLYVHLLCALEIMYLHLSFSVCCSAIEHLILKCCLLYQYQHAVIIMKSLQYIFNTFSAPSNNTLGFQGVWSIIYGKIEEQLLHGTVYRNQSITGVLHVFHNIHNTTHYSKSEYCIVWTG